VPPSIVRTAQHAARGLERAVIQLPDTEKMIFLMHDVEGYDHARIARLLGMTEDSSRQDYTRPDCGCVSCWRNKRELAG